MANRSNKKLVSMWNRNELVAGFPEQKDGLVSCDFGVSGMTELPRLHIVYHQTSFLWFENEAAAKEAGVDKSFIEMAKGKGREGEAIASHVWEKEVSHLWTCNFRRYGWSWSDSEAGEYSYCHGDVWPNGDSSIGYTTPEEMIRGSFMKSWETAMTKFGVSFHISAYSPLVTIPAMKLLNEALVNPDSLLCAKRCLKGSQRILTEEAAKLGLGKI